MKLKSVAFFGGVFVLLAGIIFVYATLWQDVGMENGALAVRSDLSSRAR